MSKNKLFLCAEGLTVTAAGIVFAVLSLKIRKNPVNVDGVLNLFIQAKFLPLFLSVLITVLGIAMTVSLWKGISKTTSDGGCSFRALAVTGLTVVYLLLVSWVGFMLPSVVYMGALLFLLNPGRKPLHLLLLTAVYALVALLVIPGILNLQLL